MLIAMRKSKTQNNNQSNSKNVRRNEAVSQNEIREIMNRSLELFHQGRYKQALELTEQTLKKSPDHPQLLNNAGILAAAIGDTNSAERYYRAILRINPNDSGTYCNLGNLLKDQQRFDEAEKSYRKALKINPDNANALFGLGVILKNQERYREAENAFQSALKCNPNNAMAHYNLAMFYKNQNRFDEAEKAFLNALELSPHLVEAHTNLGMLLKNRKSFDEAEKSFRKALDLNPNFAMASWNLSHLLLNQCRFEEGWKHYESRYLLDNELSQAMGIIPPAVSAPRYRGESLTGKSLLIWPEQGIGDELMFASIIPELSNVDCSVILACDGRLVDLFNRSFEFVNAIPKDPVNRYYNFVDRIDYHLAIGSLPYFYRNRLIDYEKQKLYLKANEDLVRKWQQRYKELEHKINIGISWFGGNDEKRQRERSVTHIDFLPIFKHQANYINLQYGDHRDEAQKFMDQTGVRIHDWEDADPIKNLDNFAAQIKALDLVISIDNSTVHFSGALGIRTFVLLPFNQEWRWMEEREDSYWYPGLMRLFRQSTYGSWAGVIEQVSEALNCYMNEISTDIIP